MARTVAKKNQPKRDFAKELEDALDLELADGLENGDLDIAASMEDLEAQISAAAEELARENPRSERRRESRREREERHCAILQGKG